MGLVVRNPERDQEGRYWTRKAEKSMEPWSTVGAELLGIIAFFTGSVATWLSSDPLVGVFVTIAMLLTGASAFYVKIMHEASKNE